jgi:beta-lactamase superfamily II metal-dependent hydrolase
MIKIKTFQAEHGDAFLLSFGDNEDINILIDMGLAQTYEKKIKPELKILKENEKKIDLLVITHVDNDHITGAITFIEENRAEQNIIEVNEVWHNSYRHLQFDKGINNELSNDEKNSLSELILQNSYKTIKNGISNVGIKEGTTLASLLYKYKYNWNTSYNLKAISVDNETINKFSNLEIILLSPNNDKLNILSKKWKDKLDEIIYNFHANDNEIFDDAFELYMQNQKENETRRTDCSSNADELDIEELYKLEEKDTSITNGASISFIIEYKGNKILFLGDSHEDLIYHRLSLLKDSGYKLKFDLVKLSHHGSNRNTSNRLLAMIDSNRFLISTNGIKKTHPSSNVISKIAMKKTDYVKTIIFNYNHSKLAHFENPLLKNKYKYELECSSEIIINNAHA